MFRKGTKRKSCATETPSQYQFSSKLCKSTYSMTKLSSKMLSAATGKDYCSREGLPLQGACGRQGFILGKDFSLPWQGFTSEGALLTLLHMSCFQSIRSRIVQYQCLGGFSGN